ncbi:MAG TPA: HypC/HybG/HupF family hydrogenase formation chaperone [Candidatus Acidoferrum sp.]|nr:HypC/HybG/HupF family hydrogenase formation chaperone [Candidatus Acidoferrum sp.]
MCLAIPGKLTEVFDQNGLRMGKVDYGGTVITACIEYTPEAEIGQYLIVHAGFALSVIDEAEAQETLALWQEMADRESAAENEQ